MVQVFRRCVLLSFYLTPCDDDDVGEDPVIVPLVYFLWDDCEVSKLS